MRILTMKSRLFLRISRKCSGACMGGDACAESAASKSSVGVTENSISESDEVIDDGDAPLVDEKEIGTLYEVWAMNPLDLQDDIRLKLEEAIDTLSFEFRDHPTLPGDPSDPTKAVSGALDKNVGLLLPLKHCAFRLCLWCGKDDEALAEHILSHHLDVIQSAMECLQILRPVVPYDEELLAMSVYKEGLAVAIRRGAPLASYSIDRRCLHEYAKHMTDEQTFAAVCFVCARRFTHVSGSRKQNDIEYANLIKKEVDLSLNAESEHFLGCKNKVAKKLFGLKSYCEVYGKISDVIVLSEMSEEFKDWHLNVTLNEEKFKVLCCPEDVQCARLENNQPAKDECCDECVAPVCKECSIDLNTAKPKLPPSSLANDMMTSYPPKI